MSPTSCMSGPTVLTDSSIPHVAGNELQQQGPLPKFTDERDILAKRACSVSSATQLSRVVVLVHPPAVPCALELLGPAAGANGWGWRICVGAAGLLCTWRSPRSAVSTARASSEGDALVSGPGGDQMTSRPEHVQRRADPSGGTLISVEVVRHCTPSGLNRGADCSARLYWMGSEAGTQPYGVPRPRLGSGRHVGDSPSGTVPPAPPARPTAARRPNAACIG
jgi:hypothetical protein